jgi:dipeptidyl aminopeptidase/acylaminoacyl peptidase
MLLPFAMALLVGGWFAWSVLSVHRDEAAAYRRAESALVNGDYGGAVEAFAQAGSYRDAAERRIATQQLLAPIRTAYLDAMTALEREEFDIAIALLEPIAESMPGFEDVGVRLEEARTGQRRALERDVDLATVHRDWMAADDALSQLIELYPDEPSYPQRLQRLRENHAPLIFVREGMLYQIGPDGQDESLLFDDFPVAAPQWSPDRRYITFFDGGAGRSAVTTLYLFEYRTGNLEIISDWAAPDPFIAWNADGSRLAFVVNAATSDMKPSDRTRLALFDPAALKLDLLPLPSSDAKSASELDGITSPTWSPDGDQLAYVAIWRADPPEPHNTNGFADVYVTDLTTGTARNLTDHAIPRAAYVTWSPASDDLLVWESRVGVAWADSAETAIWLLSASTGERLRLTSRADTTGWPSWSPDGQSYAVVAGGFTIVLRTLTGTELIRAEAEWPLAGRITWSPAGTDLLAVAASPNHPSSILHVGQENDALIPLPIASDGQWPNLGPQWSSWDAPWIAT